MNTPAAAATIAVIISEIIRVSVDVPPAVSACTKLSSSGKLFMAPSTMASDTK
ncbi:MAG: hypothetical protein R2876_05505 [Eubacteriales bacterium]